MKFDTKIKSIYQDHGKPPKKYPERPVLSAIKLSTYKPIAAKELIDVRPSKAKLLKQLQLKQSYAIQKKQRELEHTATLLGRTVEDFHEKISTDYKRRRAELKKYIGRKHVPAPGMVPCRFREITIMECLTKICTDQKEFIPVWGNYDFLVCEPLQIDYGEFPAFTITDCVPGDGDYTYSEGWVTVGSSFILNLPTTVKEIGINFTGHAWIDVDGEDHWISSNEWGRTKVWSVFMIRSRPPGGSFTHIIPGSQQEVLEKNEYNEWGPTMGFTYTPSLRSKSLNMEVSTGHEFLVDYWIKWEVERSYDYWSGACFGMEKLCIKPYIIYETCHWEYREVARFLQSLPEMSLERAKVQGLKRIV